METIDWAEEIKRLYRDGYSLKEATERVLKMREEYLKNKGDK